MRTNGALAVVREVIAKLTFADKDVEMVFPEVRHHFAELPFADDSPRDLRGDEVIDELAVALCLTPERDAVFTGQHGIAAQPRLKLLRVAGRVVPKQLAGRQAHGRKR